LEQLHSSRQVVLVIQVESEKGLLLPLMRGEFDFPIVRCLRCRKDNVAALVSALREQLPNLIYDPDSSPTNLNAFS